MVLCCLFFGVRVSLTYHLMCVHIIFSSVSVAEWPRFGFKGWIWVLIALVSVLCISFTFIRT